MAYVILAMSNASGFHHIVYVVKLSSYKVKFYLVSQAWPCSVATSMFRGTNLGQSQLTTGEALHIGSRIIKPHSANIKVPAYSNILINGDGRYIPCVYSLSWA